jgi:hypothetical protein
VVNVFVFAEMSARLPLTARTLLRGELLSVFSAGEIGASFPASVAAELWSNACVLDF